MKTIHEWIAAFKADWSWAFHHVPDDVYSELRSEGFLEADNTLTPKALEMGVVCAD